MLENALKSESAELKIINEDLNADIKKLTKRATSAEDKLAASEHRLNEALAYTETLKTNVDHMNNNYEVKAAKLNRIKETLQD